MSGFIFQCFYDIVCHIPAGTVATYGQVARLAGRPRCARTVGYAMAANRDPSVPCHRVVDRFGGTKSCFDLYGPGTQRALLEAEGVVFYPGGSGRPCPLPVEWSLLSKKTPADRCGARRLRQSVFSYHLSPAADNPPPPGPSEWICTARRPPCAGDRFCSAPAPPDSQTPK